VLLGRGNVLRKRSLWLIACFPCHTHQPVRALLGTCMDSIRVFNNPCFLWQTKDEWVWTSPTFFLLHPTSFQTSTKALTQKNQKKATAKEKGPARSVPTRRAAEQFHKPLPIKSRQGTGWGKGSSGKHCLLQTPTIDFLSISCRI